ncbi:MAG: 5-formyltetrahydrofolate cyclo-ligase [Solobacterium sp.]|nr:5-formyltetrahydrofolate cyclo-ligase [Solobacterium sp.]
MDKQTARGRGLEARRRIPDDVRDEKNRIITDILVHKIEGAHCVGCYVTLNDEADTEPLIRYCFAHQIRVAVPKVTGSTLTFYEIRSFADLKEGSFHVREPVTDIIVPPEETDVMIVPLSSFDEKNHRTGYGRGYYDSILKRCRYKIGIAFAEQKVEGIETDPWDVDLDEVVCA